MPKIQNTAVNSKAQTLRGNPWRENRSLLPPLPLFQLVFYHGRRKLKVRTSDFPSLERKESSSSCVGCRQNNPQNTKPLAC